MYQGWKHNHLWQHRDTYGAWSAFLAHHNNSETTILGERESDASLKDAFSIIHLFHWCSFNSSYDSYERYHGMTPHYSPQAWCSDHVLSFFPQWSSLIRWMQQQTVVQPWSLSARCYQLLACIMPATKQHVNKSTAVMHHLNQLQLILSKGIIRVPWNQGLMGNSIRMQNWNIKYLSVFRYNSKIKVSRLRVLCRNHWRRPQPSTNESRSETATEHQ
jgi:hypothetical protein